MAYDCRSDQVMTVVGRTMVEPSGRCDVSLEVVRDPGATSWCKGKRSPAELRASERKMVEPSGIEVERDPGATSWCRQALSQLSYGQVPQEEIGGA